MNSSTASIYSPQTLNGGLKRMADSMAATENTPDGTQIEDSEASDAKKAKPNDQPSPVLHIRNIPADTTEVEIVVLGLPFGTPTNVMVMRGAKKHQAFLEMADETQATHLVNHYSSAPATVRGRSVFIQFSNHRKLTIDGQQASAAISLAQAMMAKPATTQMAPTVPVSTYQTPTTAASFGSYPLGLAAFGATGLTPVPYAATPSLGASFGLGSPASIGAMSAMSPALSGVQDSVTPSDQLGQVVTDVGVPNSVLRIIVENMLYPVTIDILYMIFSKFGRVLKIVTFFKNGQFHALLQYADADAASAAMAGLNGQNIWNGCCMLRIDYSKLNNLEVRHDSDKARDFTKESVQTSCATDPFTAACALQLMKSKETKEQTASAFQQQTPAMGALMGTGGMLAGSGTVPQITSGAMPQIASGAMSQLASGAMSQLASGMMPQLTPGAMSQFAPGAMSQLASGAMSQFASGAMSQFAPGAMSQFASGMMPQLASGMMPQLASGAMSHLASGAMSPFTSAALLGAGNGVSPIGVTQPGSVIIVSNLEETRVTPHSLFTLFGVYGDVSRVKIMYNKRDTALIQFTEATQAQLAIQYLNGKVLYDKPMRINLSKHAYVQMPRDSAEEETHLTQDYSESKLHRYNRPGSHNARNIFPPSPTLHLSNMLPSLTEVELRGSFGNAGFTVVNFQWFRARENEMGKRDQRQMALMELASVEQAMEAVIAMHDYETSDGNHLRVTFAKNPTITPRPTVPY